jgi:hypothetical protein
VKPVDGPQLTGHGLTVGLLPRWEGRLYRRTVGEPASAPARPAALTGQPAGPSARPAASHARPAASHAPPAAPHAAMGWPGELSHPVLHLANFALPASRGDYGTGAVERMGADNVFIALLEFGPDCLGTALYSPTGLPRLTPGQFNPNGMQRRVAGQAGCQHFFTEGNRPFCLYVVIGSHRHAVALARQANDVLERIEVQHAG